MVESGAKEIGGDIYIYTMDYFKGKKSSFFLNIILERKLTAALGEKLKNMFKIIT